MTDYFRDNFECNDKLLPKHQILSRTVADRFFGDDRFFKWLHANGHSTQLWTLDSIDYMRVNVVMSSEGQDQPCIVFNYFNEDFCKLMQGDKFYRQDDVEGSLLFEYYKYLKSSDPTFPTLKVSAGRGFSNYLVLIVVPQLEIQLLELINDQTKTLKIREAELEQLMKSSIDEYRPTRNLLLAMYDAKLTADIILLTASLGQLPLCSADIKSLPPRRPQHQTYVLSDCKPWDDDFKQIVTQLHQYSYDYVPFWGQVVPHKQQQRHNEDYVRPPPIIPTKNQLELLKYRPKLGSKDDGDDENAKALKRVIHKIHCDLATFCMLFDLEFGRIPEDVEGFDYYGRKYSLSYPCMDLVAAQANLRIELPLVSYLFSKANPYSWAFWIRRHMTFNKEETLWMLDMIHKKIGDRRFNASSLFAVYLADIKDQISKDEMIDFMIKFEMNPMMFNISKLLDKVPKRYLMSLLDDDRNNYCFRYFFTCDDQSLEKNLDFSSAELMKVIQAEPDSCRYVIKCSPNLIVTMDHIIAMRRRNLGIKLLLPLLEAYKERITVDQALDLFMNREGNEDRSGRQWNNRPKVVEIDDRHFAFYIQ